MSETSDKQDNNVNMGNVKRFLKHLAKVSSYHYDRQKARDELDDHILKIKKSASKGSNTELGKHVSELDTKLDMVLKREAELLRLGRIDYNDNEGLKKKLNDLSKELAVKKSQEKHIDTLKDSVDKLSDRLNDYVKLKAEREKRVFEIEERMKKKDALKKKLRSLEDKYFELLSKGSVSKDKLDTIKDKISQVKAKI